MNFKEFIETYASELKRVIIEHNSPVYDPDDEGIWEQEKRERLKSLKRAPFRAQANAVIALAKGFLKLNERGLILTAEMGTGKTIMAICTSFLVCGPNSRTIVMCPGHLVKKWIREIKETVPHAVCVNLNRPGLFDLFRFHRTKPSSREFYVIGKERAKNHFQRVRGTMEREHLTAICPRCGNEVPEGVKANILKYCCAECGEPLWQADHKSNLRRFAKSEWVKRYLGRGFFDFFIADEVHQYKSGNSAQGQAFANFVNASKKTLCLTGTLMGGYSSNLFYLLWRLCPRRMSKLTGTGYSHVQAFSERYGVMEEIVKEVESANAASIGTRRRVTVRERPGISPLIFTDILLEISIFMRLEDVATELPPYREHVVAVDMTEAQREEYMDFERILREEVQMALRAGSRSLLGAMLQSLLAYPDGARRGEIVRHPHKVYPDTGEPLVIAAGPALDIPILPKEEKLLEVLKEQKALGRKVMVCLEHTGTRDLIPDLMERMEEAGLKFLVLRQTTTSAENREEWLKSRIQDGYDGLISNPRLVETGLDLLEFPTILFFQTGYSPFTLRQASRRSWRIGQYKPVEVYYLAYKNTMQEMALSLMATKMQVALAVEGDLSDKGLTALAEGDTSMLVQMAKSLVATENKVSVEDAWTEYTKAAIKAEMPLGNKDKVSITVNNSIREVAVTFDYVPCGTVKVHKGYAVATVDGKQYLFRNCRILDGTKVVGNYDRSMRGTLNEKSFFLKSAGLPGVYQLLQEREVEAA